MPIQPAAGVQAGADFMNQYQQSPNNQVLPQGVQAGADFMRQYQQSPNNQVLPEGIQAGADFMNRYQQSPNNQVLPEGVQAGADWMNQYQQQPENQAPPPPQQPPPQAPPAQMAEALRASDYQMPYGQEGGYFAPMQSYSKGSYGDPRAIPEAPPPEAPPEEAAPELTQETFDEQAYLNAPGNEDILAASLNDPNWAGGWKHYLRFGQGEGRGLGQAGAVPAIEPVVGEEEEETAPVTGAPMSGTPTMGPDGQYHLSEEQKAAILRSMNNVGGGPMGGGRGRRMF